VHFQGVTFSPSFSLALADALGWIGAVCVVVPYALASVGRLAGTTTWYRVLNIVGGFLLMINTWYHAAFPSVIVNVVWTIIGVYSLTRRPATMSATPSS
jgi:hypothetical protein